MVPGANVGSAAKPGIHPKTLDFGPGFFISFLDHMTDRDLSNHENNKDTYKYF
jgi:hypothetical protein